LPDVLFSLSLVFTCSVVIPTPIIRHFITGAEESSHNAVFGSLVLSCQSMKNAQIRNHFKMSPETTGILINKINSSSGAHKILRKDDIILAIDGVPVGNDKTCNINYIFFLHRLMYFSMFTIKCDYV